VKSIVTIPQQPVKPACASGVKTGASRDLPQALGLQFPGKKWCATTGKGPGIPGPFCCLPRKQRNRRWQKDARNYLFLIELRFDAQSGHDKMTPRSNSTAPPVGLSAIQEHAPGVTGLTIFATCSA